METLKRTETLELNLPSWEELKKNRQYQEIWFLGQDHREYVLIIHPFEQAVKISFADDFGCYDFWEYDQDGYETACKVCKHLFLDSPEVDIKTLNGIFDHIEADRILEEWRNEEKQSPSLKDKLVFFEKLANDTHNELLACQAELKRQQEFIDEVKEIMKAWDIEDLVQLDYMVHCSWLLSPKCNPELMKENKDD